MTREELLAKWSRPVKVLHGQGWVKVVDVMGDDGSVVEAARVTTGKGRSKHELGDGLDVLGRRCCKVCHRTGERLDVDEPGLRHDIVMMRDAANRIYEREGGDVCLEGDRRLLHYMMEHHHTSPFEFAEIVLHVRVPMDVWRQWIWHRTANVQEYSTRYSEAIDAMLITPPDAWRAQSTSNRQGSAGTVEAWPSGWEVRRSTDDRAYEVHVADGINSLGLCWVAPTDLTREEVTPGLYLSTREAELHALAREVYNERVNDFGIALEQARKDRPLANFTEAYWKIDVHNLLNFLFLRTDSHAQQEIREYADAIARFVAEWCPLTWSAFVEHRRDAVTFPASQARVLRRWLAEEEELYWILDAEGVTGRARADFLRKLGLTGGTR